jgi:DNA-binding beta-propeller fold protein YncE
MLLGTFLRRQARPSGAGAVIALALLLAPPAGATDGFGPLAGEHGCLVAVGAGEASRETSRCATAKGLFGARAVATSPDGANVYVVGGVAGNSVSLSFGAIAILKRDATTGAIAETGCISSDGTDGHDGASGACAIEPSLLGASGVAVSPDGSTVYVTSSSSASVVAFSRDALTGGLTRLGCFQATPRPGAPCAAANLLSSATSPAVSADGSALYVAEPDEGALATLDTRVDLRTPAGIVPALPAAASPTPGSPTPVSPPGGATAATPPAPASLAAIFSPSLIGDELLNPCIAINGLDGACAVSVATRNLNGLALSPDGRQLYGSASGSEAIAVFAAEASGALAETSCLKRAAPPGLCRSDGDLSAPSEVAISPDGKNLYAADRVAEGGGGQIDVLSRDPSTGALSRTGCVQFSPKPEKPEAPGEEEPEEEPSKPSARHASASAASDGCSSAPGLDTVNAVVVSGDGSAVYAIGTGSAAIFARDATTGALHESSCAVSEDERCTSLPDLAVSAAALSPDGREVYVVDHTDGTVMVFGIGAAVTSAHAAATRAGQAQVVVACPAGLRRPCRGRVELTRAVAGAASRHAGHRRRIRRLAAGRSRSFTLAPGHARRIRVELTAATRRRLAQRRRLRLMALVRAYPSGGGSGYGRDLTLRSRTP